MDLRTAPTPPNTPSSIHQIEKNIKLKIKTITERVNQEKENYATIDVLRNKGSDITTLLKNNEVILNVITVGYNNLRKLHYMYDKINLTNMEHIGFLLMENKFEEMNIRDIKLFFKIMGNPVSNSKSDNSLM